jgi:hypothetical protein
MWAPLDALVNRYSPEKRKESFRCFFEIVSRSRKDPCQSLKMTTTEGTSALPDVTYGFIGIGVMGWGMAQNLRRKMPKASTLIICELNKPRRDKFIRETEGLVKVAESPKAVAEQAVSPLISILRNIHSNIHPAHNRNHAS